MNNFKSISLVLADRAEEISKYLFPDGKKIGNEWRVGSVDGERGESLGIHLVGDKAGVFCDFATGESGDLLDLWALKRKIKLMEAIKEAREYLGVGQPKFEAHRPKKFVRPNPEKVKPMNTMSAVINYLVNERKLTVETLKTFKIGEDARKIIFPYYRDSELIFVKYLGIDRPNGKKQSYVEKDCEPCLFGWHGMPSFARSVVISEGEIDCMTLHQYGINALSVPFGAGGGDKQKWLELEFDRLSAFDDIYLCFDPDREGNLAVAELIGRLGRHRCRIVALPFKDPNECLQKEATKEQIEKCFENARTLDPEELKPASLFVDSVIDEFYPKDGAHLGYSAPWQSSKGKIFFRPNELTTWGGINGHGKSQLLGHILLSAMKQGARVCIASLEIKPKKLLYRLTRQASGLKEPTEDYIRNIHSWYGDKLWLFDLVGTAKAERLLEVFLYARQRYGIDFFVIDSFMKCGIAEEDFQSQKAFIEKLCDFKNEHNCHVHIVCHPRKSSDENQILGKLDIKGSGSITDLADNCFIVWRNKKKEEISQMKSNNANLTPDQLNKLEECDCILRCDKQRNGDWEGKLALWFDRESLQYLGGSKIKPIQYIDFSILKGA